MIYLRTPNGERHIKATPNVLPAQLDQKPQVLQFTNFVDQIAAESTQEALAFRALDNGAQNSWASISELLTSISADTIKSANRNIRTTLDRNNFN